MSTDPAFRRIAELFDAASELPEAEWQAYLDGECPDDAQVVSEVLDLLNQDARSTGPILRDHETSSYHDSHSSEFLEQLSRHQQKESRYRMEGEIARGGMGAILKVWDEDVGRPLAMKVILGQAERGGDTPAVGERSLLRFLEEAQITGQLDHPGVVPVHELGIDKEGRVYFTMRLVKGRDLSAIFHLVEKAKEGWTRTRTLGVLLKVCEAMSYAHTKGVIHRDIKPANIMVGRFGEVYVMDWGLGRVLGKEDLSAASTDEGPDQATVDFHTYREESGDKSSARALTIDGVPVGTPAFMSPEQARGEHDDVGTKSDIYAVGAVLYQLLAGHAPYASERKLGPLRLIELVSEGPPSPIPLDRNAAPELIAICDKAMARELDDRYSEIEELGDDLRAFLENRVVQAHRTGAVIEFKKWVSRNRMVAGVSLALVVAVVCAGFLYAYQLRGALQLDRMQDEQSAQSLFDEFDELYPIHPDSVSRMEQWLIRSREVTRQLPEVQSQFDSDRKEAERVGHATPVAREEHALFNDMQSARDLSESFKQGLRDWEEDYGAVPEAELSSAPLEYREYAPRELEHVISRADRLEQIIDRDTIWDFGIARPDLASTQQYVRNLDNLAHAGGLIEQIEERLALAKSLKDSSNESQAAQWSNAIAAIKANSNYESLELSRQIGLVPLREDPESLLWEFWHVLSGSRPVQGPDGRWLITEDTGLVLVLIPGGAADYGSKELDPNLPRNREDYTNYQITLTSVELAPYFISKYEVTQWQWLRAAGNNPSGHWPGQAGRQRPHVISRTNPVENISFADCQQILPRWSLAVPTDVQWEHAARGATEGPCWNGSTDLGGGANHNDKTVTKERDDFDDGHFIHASVDSYEPNPFGLYNVHGNVSEWCQDWFYQNWPKLNFREGDGLSYVGETQTQQELKARVHRGGGHLHLTPSGPRPAAQVSSADLPRSAGPRRPVA
ncbi:MAG: serine/threonine protein kinase/formylglycine-generating enzyme required for sulfatase activity [Planctomycetota bacterium]|jgi:serine/threonine protein kinase/formylglycine-generating enzyme required for sulfatase activity